MNLPSIESVSAKVHQSWIDGKLAKGVTSRKSESGEELMVPYAELSEAAKDLDRTTVIAVYDAIEAAGQRTIGELLAITGVDLKGSFGDAPDPYLGMGLAEFVELWRKNVVETPSASRIGIINALAGVLGLPVDENGAPTMPGPDWEPTKLAPAKS